MADTFQKDLYRYYGDKGETLTQRIFRPLEIKYIYCMRKAQSACRFMEIYYKLRLKRLSR